MCSAEDSNVLDDFDPNSIADPNLRRFVLQLINRQEELLAEHRLLRQENERLKDEIRRLKGQSPRPKFPGSGGKDAAASPPRNHSSEAERAAADPQPPRKKEPKLDRIVIDRDWTLDIPREQLPPDAVFKGYEDSVIQDLVLRRDNVRFLKAKFYSPSTGKTYLARVPLGYEGGYGPGIKGLSLGLAYEGQMSFPGVHRFCTQAGTLISRGQISRFLTEKQDAFHAEGAAVREAGLQSAPWVNYDVTPTRVDGKNHACHVFGNPLFTVFHTAAQQDRATVVEVLRGGALRTHRVDALALAQLAEGGLAAWMLRQLAHLPAEVTLTAGELAALLDRYLPRLGADTRHRIATATAVAAYHADPEWPVVRCLVSDDAAALHGITREHALCWVHDGRHYKKLQPEYAFLRQAVEAFRKRYWAFYHELLAFRQAPCAVEATRLEAAFDTLFAAEAIYIGLAACIERTRANKTKLLLVLRHPELPLHNNEAELAARRRVRRRDVSFGPRSPAGVKAWDTFQTLAATTSKLGISFYHYLKDRIAGTGTIPPLAEIIAARAATLNLGASWEAAPAGGP